MAETRSSDPPEELQAIRRLLAFANIAHDDGRPRPVGLGFLQSRALGLDGRHKDYALDEDAPQRFEITTHPLYGEIRTQRHGQLLRRWVRPPGEAEWLPWPPTDVAISAEQWAGFLQEWPPVGYSPGDTSVWRYADPPDDPAALDPSTISGHLTLLQHFVREQLLFPTLSLAQGWMSAEPEMRDLTAHRLQFALTLIARYTLDEPRRVLGFGDVPLEAPPLEALTTLDLLRPIEDTLWRFRCRVLRLERTPAGRGYEAESWPGHLWASVLQAYRGTEVLPALQLAAQWSLVRACKWCGRYFTYAPKPKARGRSELCGEPCNDKFHSLGRAEVRGEPLPPRITGGKRRTPRK